MLRGAWVIGEDQSPAQSVGQSAAPKSGHSSAAARPNSSTPRGIADSTINP